MQAFPHLYTNMVTCFKSTLKKDGIRGLYAGTVPALAANIAENSVLFASYGVCQKAVAWAIDTPVRITLFLSKLYKKKYIYCYFMIFLLTRMLKI